jgi:ABC-type antimicrobial peptide transport system permease subunit
MNMMLASVVERTREIGLRMALSATERAVQAQFLVESVILCLCGGIAGVGASAAGPLAVNASSAGMWASPSMLCCSRWDSR